jgi:hypothetical protein
MIIMILVSFLRSLKKDESSPARIIPLHLGRFRIF